MNNDSGRIQNPTPSWNKLELKKGVSPGARPSLFTVHPSRSPVAERFFFGITVAGFLGRFPRLRVRAEIDGPNPEGRSTDMKVKTNVKAGDWLMQPAGNARP